MIFTPTKSKRNVVLAAQFVGARATQPQLQSSQSTQIARICALFADHESITEGLFNHKNEATLLRRFWQAINAGDRIFAADVEKALSLIRQRSWDLDVIPSPEIDLRKVYCQELWDTEVPDYRTYFLEWMGGKMNWERVRKENLNASWGSIYLGSDGTWGLPPVVTSKTIDEIIVASPAVSKRVPTTQSKPVSASSVEEMPTLKYKKLIGVSGLLSNAIKKNDMHLVAKLASEIYGESFVRSRS